MVHGMLAGFRLAYKNARDPLDKQLATATAAACTMPISAHRPTWASFCRAAGVPRMTMECVYKRTRDGGRTYHFRHVFATHCKHIRESFDHATTRPRVVHTSATHS